MENQENFITLKEAADISGYSPDYIGQLIRAGKLPGKQVYTNITWLTTAEAVLGYKQGKNQPVSGQSRLKEFLIESKRKFKLELDIVRLFLKTFKIILPLLVILIIGFFLLTMFFARQFFPNSNSGSTASENGTAPLSY